MTPLNDLILAQLPEEKELNGTYHGAVANQKNGYNNALKEIRSKLESLDLTDWVRVSDVLSAVEKDRGDTWAWIKKNRWTQKGIAGEVDCIDVDELAEWWRSLSPHDTENKQDET